MTPREPEKARSSRTVWLTAWLRFVRRHNIAVLALSLILAVLAGAYTAENVKINTSTSDMLSEDLPFQRHFEALDEAFPQDYRTIVVVVDGATPEQAKTAADKLATGLAQHPDLIRNVFHPAGDPFFRRHGLLYLSVDDLQTAGSMMAGAQPLLAALAQDPSLRGLAEVLTLALRNIEQMGTGNGGLPPQFEATLQGIATTVENVEAGRPTPFSWRGALSGDDVDPQLAGTRQLLLLEPSFDFSSLQPAERAIGLIRAKVAELGLTPENGVRVRLTGEPVMMGDELKSVQESIGIANVLSLAIVIVLLIIGLRSGRLVEATTFSLLVGLSWTAFFAVAAVGELNLISVAFAVLFIGFGVDFGIHFCMRAKEYIDADIVTGLALEEAGVGVAPGLTLTTIAASIGFLSFVPTDYRGLVELGIISSFGMLVALGTSLSIVPAYLKLRPPHKSDQRQQRALSTGFERILAGRARLILWGALALGALAATALPLARFDDSPLNLRDPESESVSTLFDLLADDRFNPFRAAVLANNATEAEAISAKLRALPEVKRVETARDLVPDHQEEKLAMVGDMALMLAPVLSPGAKRTPPTPAELSAAIADLHAAAAAEAERSPGARRLAEALGRFSMTNENLARLQTALIANLPPMLSELADSLDAQEVTLADVPPTLLSRRQTPDGKMLVEVFPKAGPHDQAGRRRFAAAVQSVVPEASGEAIAVTEGGKAVIKSFYQAGAFTFALITLLLIVVLRSLRDVLMAMAPLILAGLLTVATTVILDVPFNFANVIVLPLLFGLGVSSGINMAVRGRQQGSGSLLITSTPKAVLFSALTAIGSLGSLALSTHPGMASMGLLLTVALVYSTLCTLIVLPALRQVLSSTPSV
jgi:uncharacterized protein